MVTILSKEERNICLLELIDNMDVLSSFFQSKSLKKEEISSYKPILTNFISNYSKLETYQGINIEIDPNKDNIFLKLNLLRIAYTESEIKSAEKIYFDLIDEGIEEVINNLQKKLSKSFRNPYNVWLEDQNDAIQKLKKEHLEAEYSFKSIEILYDRFSKFIGSRISVKLINNSNSNYKFVPMYFFNGKYVELKNPLTDGRWLLSGNAIKFEKQLKTLKVGTLIKVNYRLANKNKPQFYSSLLSLEYNDFEVLNDNFEVILAEYFTEVEIREIYKKINIKFGSTQILAEGLIKLLISNSDSLKKELEEARFTREQMENEIKQLVNSQELFNIEKAEIKNQLSEDQKRWADTLSLIDYEIEANHDLVEHIPYNNMSFMEDLQARIYNQSENELLYDEHILAVTLNAIRSNILTILSGPSGTGKSSLIEALGEAIVNVKVTLVPVQSSWTDAQDLLGYFHPNEKIFVATPFMEALALARIAALKNRDELHIICLDEMNLAHIEYYFAQFLSIREQNEKTLNLYPKRYYHWAADVDAGHIDTDFYTKQNAKELLTKYPAIFEVPSNVRFVGTLNMDHTVKALSPKVVDRSIVVELLKLSEQQKAQIVKQVNQNNNTLPIKVPLNEFLTSNFEFNQKAYKNILNVSSVFKNFRDIPINSRGEKHLKEILSYWDNPSTEIVDLLIKGKILPRIETKKSAIENLGVMESLKDYTKSTSKMTEMLNTNHTVSFW